MALAWMGEVEVRDGEETRLDFELPKGGVVELSIQIDDLLPSHFAWSLRAPDSRRIPDVAFPLSSNRSASILSIPIRLQLPTGQYTFDADFGDLGRASNTFTIIDSDDPLAITIMPGK